MLPSQGHLKLGFGSRIFWASRIYFYSNERRHLCHIKWLKATEMLTNPLLGSDQGGCHSLKHQDESEKDEREGRIRNRYCRSVSRSGFEVQWRTSNIQLPMPSTDLLLINPQAPKTSVLTLRASSTRLLALKNWLFEGNGKDWTFFCFLGFCLQSLKVRGEIKVHSQESESQKPPVTSCSWLCFVFFLTLLGAHHPALK